jgi:hypothetical protein
VMAFAEGTTLEREDSYPVAWDGVSFSRAERETGNLFSVGGTPSGLFAKVDPCSAVVPGRRLARVNAALLAYVDSTYGTGFGRMQPAPELRGTGG